MGLLGGLGLAITVPFRWRTLSNWEADFDDKLWALMSIVMVLLGFAIMGAGLWFNDESVALKLIAVVVIAMGTWNELKVAFLFVADYATGQNREEWQAKLASLRQPKPTTENVQYVGGAYVEKRTPTFPDNLRTEHAVIVAQSGHGKTQLLQSLILDDLEKERTVIVLDSQSQLIANLLNVVPVSGLVYLSPGNEEAPLALNLFDYGQDASLFEYMFASLDADMTSKQSTVFRYLARLMGVIPNATLETMRQVLEPKGIEAYREHLSKLPPLAKSFFEQEFSSAEYKDTRQQTARRLYTLLENDAFRQMFTARNMKLYLPKEMNDGKVILINAAKRTLKGDAFKIFGRFFISQIARAIFDREHPYQKRVSIYIDEFQEYAGDEEFIAELFTQARKFNVALTVAFQHLDMLPTAVRSAILTNTSIKVAGSLSTPDRRIFASEMGLKAEDLLNLKKGQFVALYKGSSPQYLNVEFGRLEGMGTRSKAEIRAIEKRMASLYGEVPVVEEPTPTTPKLNFEDFKDRD